MRKSLALAMTWVLSGCTATITQRSGVDIEGEILGGDRQVIWVKVLHGRGHRVVTVERADIVDIDHPGNVGLVVGAPIALMGVLGMFADGSFGSDRWDEPDERPERRSNAAGQILGGAMLLAPCIWGLSIWVDSRLDAQPPEDAAVSWGLAPGGVQVRW